MRITALDLGATTGLCFGEAGAAPIFLSLDLRAELRGERGAILHAALLDHIRDFEPDVMWIEAPPALAGMVQRGTTQDVLMALYGFDMVACMAAIESGLRFEHIDAQEARQKFLGVRPSKGKGKEAVFNRCRLMKWEVVNNNEADAGCVWWAACAAEAPSKWMQAVQRCSAARAS